MRLNLQALTIVFVVAGCGPAVEDGEPAESEGAGSTAGDPAPDNSEPESSSTSSGPDGGETAPGAGETTSPETGEASSSGTDGVEEPPPLQPDEELCLDYCLHVPEADTCTIDAKGCYTRCLDSLAFQDEAGCGDVAREVLACESTAEIDDWCYSVEGCRDLYIESDFCQGYYSYFDGYPGSGGSVDGCSWRSRCLGDTVSVEMQCGLGDDPQCTCWVDDEQVGECTHEGTLVGFDCGGEEQHVLNGCCEPFFREVLQ